MFLYPSKHLEVPTMRQKAKTNSVAGGYKQKAKWVSCRNFLSNQSYKSGPLQSKIKKSRSQNKQNMEPWKHSTLTRMWNCSYANRNNNLETVGSGGKSGRITQPGYLHQTSLVGIKDLSQQSVSEIIQREFYLCPAALL